MVKIEARMKYMEAKVSFGGGLKVWLYFGKEIWTSDTKLDTILVLGYWRHTRCTRSRELFSPHREGGVLFVLQSS